MLAFVRNASSLSLVRAIASSACLALPDPSMEDLLRQLNESGDLPELELEPLGGRDDRLVVPGHPVLHAPAPPTLPAPTSSPAAVQKLIETPSDNGGLANDLDLLVDVLATHGALGRVFVVDAAVAGPAIDPLSAHNETADEEDDIVAVAWIDPTVVSASSPPSWFWEGCLSLPGLYGWVARPSAVVVSGWTATLTAAGSWSLTHSADMRLEDLPARVFLHEADHLDGRLFPDRLSAPASPSRPTSSTTSKAQTILRPQPHGPAQAPSRPSSSRATPCSISALTCICIRVRSARSPSRLPSFTSSSTCEPLLQHLRRLALPGSARI
ncbi:peptide deformylase 2 [Thecamonas trahens ATCC 50062]|uniref:Peptide deformylase n=1 Tax=Thecamonas trahens ATCC 50062 TaxID=461836 RepID=A0A0L0DSX2_THETB|nr:peptide deformylase 2 [Thecamonas trahens ATCC 50062]KNC54553.1 peptide deformylase 2 [Thecamonas trahens ATCC 50062]|eukprot:XP_013753568.1 peptide deformylase 2 [Thecamonas trahens ATCC 50062]